MTLKSYFLFRVALLGLNQVVCLVDLATESLLLVDRAHFLESCVLAQRLDRGVGDVAVLDLTQIELLRTQDGAGSRDSVPTNEHLGRDLVVLHGVDADQGSGPAEACLAVDSDSTSAWLREVLLTTGDKAINNVLGWHRPIHKDQVLMLDSLLSEGTSVVLRVVESHDLGDVQMFEDVDVAVSSVAILPSLTGHAVHRPHKRKELAWDNPVEIAVLYLLVVLVLFYVEGVVVVPALFDAKLKTLDTVLHSALIEALALASIPVSPEEASVRLELLHRFGSCLSQADDHERGDQEGTVRHLDAIAGVARVVVDTDVSLVLVRLEKLLKLAAVAVDVG